MQQLKIEHKSNNISKVVSNSEELENLRERKGYQLALSRNVYRLLGTDVYYVQIEHSNKIYYYVKYIFNSFEFCSCLDNSVRGTKCKHQFAIEYAIMKGTLKDIENLPKEAKRDNMVSKSYRDDDYDF